MIIVSGKVKTAPGALEKVRKDMETVITATRAEKGCIDYSYGIDVIDPDTFIILEYWEDWAALEAHFTQPHMAVWMASLGKTDILERDVKAFSTDETRQLLS